MVSVNLCSTDAQDVEEQGSVSSSTHSMEVDAGSRPLYSACLARLSTGIDRNLAEEIIKNELDKISSTGNESDDSTKERNKNCKTRKI